MSIWRRPWFLWTAEILLVLICCLGAWKLVANRVTSGDDYIAMPDDVVVTPLPQWIQTDVKRQVLQNASLDDGESILDGDLVRRFADAFPMHPWVESVKSVRKQYPATVIVDIIYRKPVAMVVVPDGLYAVDVNGVLLPSEDFTEDSAARYPRIDEMTVPPQGQVGDAWGDGRVAAASRLAAALQEHWSDWELSRIVPARNSPPAGEPSFEIVTQSGGRINWGIAPSLESLRAAQPDHRIDQLTQYAAEHGSVNLEATQQLNLNGPATDGTRQAAQPANGQQSQR